MLPKIATRDEFTADGHTVVHEPTGATFVREGRKIRAANWGRASLTLGVQYDPAQIKEEAMGIFLNLPLSPP